MVKLRCAAWAALILVSAALTSCNMPQRVVSGETLSSTEVYQTVSFKLTATAAPGEAETALPGALVSPTSAATVTQPATATAATGLQPISAATTPPPSVVCNQAAAGRPIDVTIPDDAPMQPGQSFTKIWRLQNTGACAWSEDYQVFRFSGESMGAPENIRLSQVVAPGQSVEIAVDMIAPKGAGTFQSNWKLRNAQGSAFGIGPNGQAPFWVRIVVLATPTTSPSPAPPVLSPAPSETSTTAPPDPTRTNTPGASPAVPAPTPTPTLTPTATVTTTLNSPSALSVQGVLFDSARAPTALPEPAAWRGWTLAGGAGRIHQVVLFISAEKLWERYIW
ncbi:MAG TPA: NBR1-Ig-like domain-containing protein [Anaerolineales bacterium]|nr:NBR1-Ig-like domain-containing protein [Anaerolineales bacterium]